MTMKKFVILLLIAGATVYAYYWYVRGINLMIEQDELTLPPYSYAQRIPPKVPPTNAPAAPPAKPAVQEYEWSNAAPMPTPRSEVASASIGQKIYVIGGIDGFARTSSVVEVFDAKENAWTKLKPLPKGVHHSSAIAVGGKIYVFGGLTGLGGTPVDSLYIYDPDKDQWSRGKDLPDAVGGSALVNEDGRVHMLGGRSIGSDVDSHYIYNIADNGWDSGPELISGREQFGAALFGRKLYVFGGSQGGVLYNTDAVEVLDLDRGIWDPAATMPLKRSDMAVISQDGKVFVFGGEGPTTTFDQVDVYDQKSDHWTTIKEKMPSARHGLAGAYVNGSFFLIGGGKRTSISVTDANEVMSPLNP
ncbi:MAG TPA: kelch repeat-containing protein [Candidatus Eisenbacteria bacterium]|jgi:N-acetylneuraminic acid mutarotase|nr:kelch repeat-containing protein [Candidatus Eisenbacteria bacterium]